MKIHKLACVDSNAKIGKNVEIGPFAYVEGDVEIGEGTKIHSGAKVLNGSRIGKGCNIHSGAVIAGIPQDLKFRGEETIAVIGDYTSIRECCTINRGTASKGKTVVGNNCLLMAYVHVAHDTILGNGVIVANNVQIAGEVIVEDFAVLGGSGAVHQFCRVGRHAMISGATSLNKDVPPYSRAVKHIGVYNGINVIGLKRHGFSTEVINDIQDTYRYLYQKGLNVSDALKFIKGELPKTKERDIIIEFIENSKRGILKGTNRGVGNDDSDDEDVD